MFYQTPIKVANVTYKMTISQNFVLDHICVSYIIVFFAPLMAGKPLIMVLAIRIIKATVPIRTYEVPDRYLITLNPLPPRNILSPRQD